MIEGSPNFPLKFPHPLILEGVGERDLGERKRKNRGGQQLLCLIVQRLEKKEFRIRNSLWHGIF